MFLKSRELLAGLFVLELAILIAIVNLLGGARVGAAGFSGLHGTHIAAGGTREVGVFQAGAAPSVVVRDPDSHVVVTVSQDGRVHVVDQSHLHGFVFGGPTALMPLSAKQTGPDSVLVERASQPGTWIMGESRRRIELAVPPGTHLDVETSSATDVTGLQAALKVRSQDGHIGLWDISGDVDVASDDGHIELHNVRATHVSVLTNDGRITAEGLVLDGESATATLHTDSGSVHVSGAVNPAGTYKFDSNDGGITADLAGAGGLALSANSGDGSINIDGRRVRSSDDTTPYHAAGTSGGSLELTTRDGRITLNTSGAKQP